MPRSVRIHLSHGTYYVIQERQDRRPIFACPEDFGTFEQMLASAVRRAGAKVQAYCWMTESVHLVVRLDQVALGNLMQDVNCRFAQSVQRRTGEGGPFFARRYHAVLIDPRVYLLELLRYVHYIPVFAGLVSEPGAHECSSHRVYLHRRYADWLDLSGALRLGGLEENQVAYHRFMAQPPSPEIRSLFDRGRQLPTIVGGGDFLAALPRSLRRYTPKLSVDDVLNRVSILLDVSRDRILSSSREHDLALARALIGWYSIERRISTLLGVAHFLHRAPSTLSTGISRYRELRPDLFSLDVFRYQAPIAVVRGPVAERLSE